MALAFWDMAFRYSYQWTESRDSLNQAVSPNSFVWMPISMASLTLPPSTDTFTFLSTKTLVTLSMPSSIWYFPKSGSS